MSKLDIFLVDSQNAFLVFDLRQSVDLRESKRICARLIGSHSSSSSKSQRHTVASVPAMLTLEEMGVLIEAYPSEISLLESADATRADLTALAQFKSEYEAHKSKFAAEQNQLLRDTRREQLNAMREKILSGKRQKLNLQLARIIETDTKRILLDELNNLEANFELELEKLGATSSNNKQVCGVVNTEIFVKTPQFYQLLYQIKSVPCEDFWLRNKETFTTCRYRAFKHFWSQGYFLTGGTKFGGDFLVYPGDPAKFHSQFILVCLEEPGFELGSLTFKQLITYARMATSVKKTFLLAFSSNSNSQLNFISINWSHI